MIELGRTYKDKITGFQGVATGHVEYISGCHQTLLVPPVGKNGESREGVWYDDQRLQVVGKSRIELDNGTTPGHDAAPAGRLR